MTSLRNGNLLQPKRHTNTWLLWTSSVTSPDRCPLFPSGYQTHWTCLELGNMHARVWIWCNFQVMLPIHCLRLDQFKNQTKKISLKMQDGQHCRQYPKPEGQNGDFRELND